MILARSLLMISNRSSNVIPVSLRNKLLFLGYYSDISDGKMPNKLGSDWLTISGSAGSETYQCPNTADYIAADTDYIWFKTDESQRTTTTAELIGYDFSRTIIKYDNTYPYQLRWFGVLKAGEVLTTSEDNSMRDLFELSIWWSGTLSLYGSVKGNRGVGKNTWTPEEVMPLLFTDTDVFAWWDILDESTVTKPSNLVSAINDKNSSGNNLLQSGADNIKPIWDSNNGITLDGIRQYIGTGAKTLNQPVTIYMVVYQKSFVNATVLFRGNSEDVVQMQYLTSGNKYNMYAGSTNFTNAVLPNKFAIITVVLNGDNSVVMINDTVVSTGNPGSNNLSGFLLGKYYSYYMNASYKEILIRKTADDTDNRLSVRDWLKSKHSIVY